MRLLAAAQLRRPLASRSVLSAATREELFCAYGQFGKNINEIPEAAVCFKSAAQCGQLSPLAITKAIALAVIGYIAASNTIARTMDERIKQARIAQGWSQADLARRMFVTQPSVADWESGRKAPHTKNLTRLAVMLGVNFEWLTTGRGEMRSSSTPGAHESATDDWILPEERRLLSSYSRLKPQQRTALLVFLEALE